MALQLVRVCCQQGTVETGSGSAAAELRLLQQEVASLKQGKLDLQDELLQLHRNCNVALTTRLLQAAPDGLDEPASARRVLSDTILFGDPVTTSRARVGPQENSAATSTSAPGIRPEHQNSGLGAEHERSPRIRSEHQSSSSISAERQHLRSRLVQQYRAHGESAASAAEQRPQELGAGFIAERFDKLASSGIQLEGFRHHLGGYSGTIFGALILPFCCFLACSCYVMSAPEDASGNPLTGCKATEVRLTNFRPFLAFASLAAMVVFVLYVTGCLSQLEGMVMRKVADLVVAIGALLMLVHMIFDRLRHLEQLVKAKIEEEIQNLEHLFTDVHKKVQHIEEEGAKTAEEVVREVVTAPSSFTTDLFNWHEHAHTGQEGSPAVVGTQVSVPEDGAGRGNYQLLSKDESPSSCFTCLRTGHANSARSAAKP